MAHGGVVELKARSGHPRDGLRGMERRVGSVARLVPRRAMGAWAWLSGPRHPIEIRRSGIRRCNGPRPSGRVLVLLRRPESESPRRGVVCAMTPLFLA